MLGRPTGSAGVRRTAVRPAPEEAGASQLKADYPAASDAVNAWFAKTTQAAGNTTLLTVAELVAEARRLTFTGKDGKPHSVSEQLKVGDAETMIRVQAKARGVALIEHRDMADAKGVQSELAAVLENLGGLPSSLKLGGDSANLELHIAGKVTGELAMGGAKLKGEGSAEGGEATVELPGGTEIGAKGGPEGKTAEAMAKGANDPKAPLEHGGAVKDAVSSAVEKAKKSAEQHKPGWQLGATAKGSPTSGTSVMFTLTIVF